MFFGKNCLETVKEDPIYKNIIDILDTVGNNGNVSSRIKIDENTKDNDPLVKIAIGINKMLDSLSGDKNISSLDQNPNYKEIKKCLTSLNEGNTSARAKIDEACDLSDIAFEVNNSINNYQSFVKNFTDNVLAAVNGDITAEIPTSGMLGDFFTAANAGNEAILSLKNGLNSQKELDVKNKIEQLQVDKNGVIINSGNYIVDNLERVQKIVSKLEGINSEVLDNAVGTSKGAKDAANKVQDMNLIITEVKEIIKNISNVMVIVDDGTDKIQKSTIEIRNISDATKQLALNAEVIAAKAGGEHGKEFSVIAEEIRKLSNNSKHTADNITAIVTVLDKKTDSLSSLIKKSDERSDEMVKNATDVGEIISDLDFRADCTSKIIHFSEDILFAIARILDHIKYKKDGDNRIFGNKEDVMPPHLCTLGLWYYERQPGSEKGGEGFKRFGNLSSYKTLEVPHNVVHNEMAAIIKIAQNDQIVEKTEEIIERRSTIELSSINLFDDLLKLVEDNNQEYTSCHKQ